jgi:hypothetical protein
MTAPGLTPHLDGIISRIHLQSISHGHGELIAEVGWNTPSWWREYVEAETIEKVAYSFSIEIPSEQPDSFTIHDSESDESWRIELTELEDNGPYRMEEAGDGSSSDPPIGIGGTVVEIGPESVMIEGLDVLGYFKKTWSQHDVIVWDGYIYVVNILSHGEIQLVHEDRFISEFK